MVTLHSCCVPSTSPPVEVVVESANVDLLRTRKVEQDFFRNVDCMREQSIKAEPSMDRMIVSLLCMITI
jgi:hypothetical protein